MTMPILYLIIVWIGNILQKIYLDLIKSEGLEFFLQNSQKLNYAFKCGQIDVKSCMHISSRYIEIMKYLKNIASSSWKTN